MRVATFTLIIALSACAYEPSSHTHTKFVRVEKPGKTIVYDASYAQLRNALIGSSIDRYLLIVSRNCPCPYSQFTRAGKQHDCKSASAYCKGGGESPLCYPEDITDEMLDHYRHWNADRVPMRHMPLKKQACS